MAMTGDKRRERFYDTIAGEFDRTMNRYDLDKRLHIVYERLLQGEKIGGALLLDAGCGTGWFSAQASARGARVVSFDIGRELLLQAGKKCRTARVQGSALDLPFGEGTFDHVVSSEMIEHTADPRRAVAELLRVVKPGGALALTVPNRLWRPAALLATRLRLRPYQGYENYVRRSSLLSWVGESGAAIEEFFGFHLFPFVSPLLYPLLDACDRWGRALGPLMVNIALKARKKINRE
jgi:2-polyprenyl-6-hydroxyphenyl methylase/3-demethylubiquinone-9 3-methyltransferase